MIVYILGLSDLLNSHYIAGTLIKSQIDLELGSADSQIHTHILALAYLVHLIDARLELNWEKRSDWYIVCTCLFNNCLSFGLSITLTYIGYLHTDGFSRCSLCYHPSSIILKKGGELLGRRSHSRILPIVNTNSQVSLNRSAKIPGFNHSMQLFSSRHFPANARHLAQLPTLSKFSSLQCLLDTRNELLSPRLWGMSLFRALNVEG